MACLTAARGFCYPHMRFSFFSAVLPARDARLLHRASPLYGPGSSQTAAPYLTPERVRKSPRPLVQPSV
jgi:hypothetical protein